MPYFKISVTKKLTEEEREKITEGLGIALETVPGKARFMLIRDREDAKIITMGGVKQDNFVFADLHYCGKQKFSVKKKLAEAVFAVFSDVIGTKPEFASLTITEHDNWGGFGDFRDEFFSD
jgi:phenylpyruvate tautomerase PptA (4-oxalocrotonate tautomerase family)